MKTPAHNKPRVIVTGASGFLGKVLVPEIEKAGFALLLVGRDQKCLSAAFPHHPCCDYNDLETLGNGAQALLHLAILNNNLKHDNDAFFTANVALLKQTLDVARKAGVRQIIYPASLKADPQASEGYEKSKYLAEQLLLDTDDLQINILRLPPVYGDNAYRGRLSNLMRLPEWLRAVALDLLGSLKPTVHVDHVVSAVLSALEHPGTPTRIVSNRQHGNVSYQLGKWLMDIGFSLAVSILFGWLLILLWAAVRLTSAGPGIFSQERLGLNGQTFTCFKFRTMALGTAQVGTHEAPSNAVTSIGSVLRKLKLDELPQIWNILRGELSLVGPRPNLPNQTELITARQAHNVYEIRPGITGLGQIRGVDMSIPEKLAEIDAEYIALRTLPLDLRILIATFVGRGFGDRLR